MVKRECSILYSIFIIKSNLLLPPLNGLPRITNNMSYKSALNFVDTVEI